MTTDIVPADKFAIDAAAAELEAQLADYGIELEQQFDRDMDRSDQKTTLAEWAIGKLHELDAAEEAIKKMAKDHLVYLLSDAKHRRESLLWKFKDQIRAQVDADLADKKRKSVTYATGKAGYRASAERETLVVDDEEKAIAWAGAICAPTLILRSIDKSAINEFYKETGRIPAGCHIEKTPASNNFFIGPVTVTKPELPYPVVKMIEQKRQSTKEFFGTSAAETEVPFDKD